VAPPAVQYFAILAHKRQDFFGGKKELNVKYVFLYSLQLLCEAFLILRRINRDIIMNVRRFLCRVPCYKINAKHVNTNKVKVKQSRYRPGVTQRVPRS
jgi:hypothetical protein